MDYLSQFVFIILYSNCVAVNIKRIDVPSAVEAGTDSVILDCDYSISIPPETGLVVKWFFNGSFNLIYQWIPPLKPQVLGILKRKVDLNFKISEDPFQKHRAIKILKPTTDLSGNYTCVVSTFTDEDQRTRPMLVYSTGRGFHFLQEKKYVFLVTLICFAEELYPKPVMQILSRGKPLSQAKTETKMNSWGLYSITATALVHDSDVSIPHEEFVCSLTLPIVDWNTNKTTIYYPGLMPTAYISDVEMEKHQKQQSNRSQGTSSSSKLLYCIVWCLMHLYRGIKTH